MSDKIKTGGPAFPSASNPYGCITKRQYYAGMAMQGMLSNPEARIMSPEKVACWAFEHADSMIAHEEKENVE